MQRKQSLPAETAVASISRSATAVVAVLVAGAGIVAAGTPARGLVLPDATEVLSMVPHQVNPATVPAITVQQDVADWNHEIAGPGMEAIVVRLAENLDLESQALLRHDPSILSGVDHGDRLAEMQARLQAAVASGQTTIEQYRFDALDVSLLQPFAVQSGLSLGFGARGAVTEQTYDATGALVAEHTAPFASTFAVRRATGARWLNVAVLPTPGGSGTVSGVSRPRR